MKALPPGRILASAVGMWVWVPNISEQRPSSQWPIATFSLEASAWMSQTQTFTCRGSWFSTRSAAANGSSLGRFMKIRPSTQNTATLTPELVVTTVNSRVLPPSRPS